MAKLLACPTRLTKCFFRNCVGPSTFVLNSSNRHFNPAGKYFFSKVTSSLFKDSSKDGSSKDSGECSKPAGNPCQPKSSNTKNVCGSSAVSVPKNPTTTELPKEVSDVSKVDPCASPVSRGPRGCQPAVDCNKFSKPEKIYQEAPPLEDPCSQNRQKEAICPLPGQPGRTCEATSVSKPVTISPASCKPLTTGPAACKSGSPSSAASVCKSETTSPAPCKPVLSSATSRKSEATYPASSPNPSTNPCSPIVKAESTSTAPCKPGITPPAPKPLPDVCSAISKNKSSSAGFSKPGMTSRVPIPPDDPCMRDCKLLRPPPCCEKPLKPEPCSSEPPSSICPPTKEDEKKQKFFKRISLMVALPIVFLASIIIQMRAREEDKQPRPEFVPMEYMYRRTKRFPWGDGNHTLFHNPIKNAVPPDGYEVEDPHAATSE